MSTTNGTGPLEKRLQLQRSDLLAAATALAAAGEKRRLTGSEETSLEVYLGDVERVDARLEALRRPATPVVVRSEPLTYERHGTASFCLDVAFLGERPGSQERIQRHRQEMDVELAARRADGDARFDAVAADERMAVERRTNPNTATGQGGYFAVPLWMLDEWGALGRSARPLADLVPSAPLPRGIQQVAVPRFTVNPTVAAQAGDAASIAMPDFTDAAVTAPVRTIAGGVLVAQQLRDQAGTAGIDEILFRDLALDYAMKLEQQVLNGSGTGQLTGILNVAGITAVSYTDATPTWPELGPVLGQAFAQFGSNRLQPPEVWVMAPRRWGWLASQVDTTGRTFVDLAEDEPSLFGTPVVLDGAMPLTLSTNQDAIIAVKPTDMRLFESELTVGAAVDHAGAGNLQVRLFATRYVAFLGGRVPTAIAAVTGTGLAQVTNYG